MNIHVSENIINMSITLKACSQLVVSANEAMVCKVKELKAEVSRV